MAISKENPRFTIHASWQSHKDGMVDYHVALKDKERTTQVWTGKKESPFELRVVMEKAAKLRKRVVKAQGN